MHKGRHATLWCAVLVTSGCGGGEQPSRIGVAENAPTVATSTTTPPPASGDRGVSAIKACDVVSGADVERLAGGRLATPPTASTAACRYVIELADGGAEGYSLAFQSAVLARTVWAAQSADERGERIDGPWDEAWLGKQPMTAGVHLSAVQRDLAVEVGGERKAVVVGMARLAAARLP